MIRAAADAVPGLTASTAELRRQRLERSPTPRPWARFRSGLGAGGDCRLGRGTESTAQAYQPVTAVQSTAPGGGVGVSFAAVSPGTEPAYRSRGRPTTDSQGLVASPTSPDRGGGEPDRRAVRLPGQTWPSSRSPTRRQKPARDRLSAWRRLRGRLAAPAGLRPPAGLGFLSQGGARKHGSRKSAQPQPQPQPKTQRRARLWRGSAGAQALRSPQQETRRTVGRDFEPFPAWRDAQHGEAPASAASR